MQRTFLKNPFKSLLKSPLRSPRKSFLSILAVALLTGGVAYGQSLADVARANRERQNADDASKKPVVITTDDLTPEPHSDPAPSPAHAKTSGKTSRDLSQPLTGVDERAAAQWRRQILAQKDKVTALQAQIDQLNARIHPAGSAQFEGPSSRNQARQQEHVAEIQLQLDEQKKKLAELQEEARRAGMHTAVYDP